MVTSSSSTLNDNWLTAASSPHSLKTSFAEMLIGDLDTNDYYLFFGKPDSWTDDTAPPDELYTKEDLHEIWDGMVGLKKITSEDARLVLKRYDWEAGSVYDQWNDADSGLYTEGPVSGDHKKFYVVVSDNFSSEIRVYKCVHNNDGTISTLEPEATTGGVFGTVKEDGDLNKDGYKWSLTYDIQQSDFDFVTDEWVPVKFLTSDDGTLQWDVQEAAVGGSVDSVLITTAGSGYEEDGVYDVVVDTLESDGTGFTGTTTIVGGVVTIFTITNAGSGYTKISLSVSTSAGTPTTAAVFNGIVSPVEGHGSNAVKELKPDAVMMNVNLIGSDDSSKLNVSNDFRQFGIIKNPKNADGTSAESLTYRQTMTLNLQKPLVNGSVFSEDSIVYQGSSLSAATSKATVVSWNAGTSELCVTDVKGNWTTQSTAKSDTGSVEGFINSIEQPEIQKFSGDIIYYANRRPLDRDANQAENFKIVINL